MMGAWEIFVGSKNRFIWEQDPEFNILGTVANSIWNEKEGQKNAS